MSTSRILAAALAGLAATSLFASTALADATVPIGSVGPVQPGDTIDVGQAMNVSVSATQAAGELFRMDYPGGNGTVMINARIDGLSNTAMSAAGFDVYDDQNGMTPVEHITMASNEFNQDPHLLQFVYSSGQAQTVTIQFFNWSQTPLTLEVMPVQLPSTGLIKVGETVPGSATAVGISSVAGITIKSM